MIRYECLKAGIHWRVSWIFVALAVPLGALIGAHFLSPIVNGPTVYLRDVKLLNPTVRAGEPLRLLIHAAVRVTSRCTGSVAREFHKLTIVEGQLIREKVRLGLGAAPIPIPDEPLYVVEIDTPNDLTPGHWQFLGRTTLDCGILFSGINHFDTPFVDFNVVP